MASFQIPDLKTTEVLDGSSFVPATITQNESYFSNGTSVAEAVTATRKLTVSALRSWFDSGIYKQIRSGPSVKVVPENFTTSGTINFHSPGLVALYSGVADPEGWLICNGRTVSKTTYPELFGLLGYHYGGSGDSFSIPDLSDRGVFGLDNMSGASAGRVTDSSLLGATGVSSHILTQAQSPFVGHNHPTYNGFYTHTYGISYQGNQYDRRPEDLRGSPDGGICFGQTVSIDSTEIQTPSPHSNLCPYLNLNWIIKI